MGINSDQQGKTLNVTYLGVKPLWYISTEVEPFLTFTYCCELLNMHVQGYCALLNIHVQGYCALLNMHVQGCCALLNMHVQGYCALLKLHVQGYIVPLLRKDTVQIQNNARITSSLVWQTIYAVMMIVFVCTGMRFCRFLFEQTQSFESIISNQVIEHICTNQVFKFMTKNLICTNTRISFNIAWAMCAEDLNLSPKWFIR